MAQRNYDPVSAQAYARILHADPSDQNARAGLLAKLECDGTFMPQELCYRLPPGYFYRSGGDRTTRQDVAVETWRDWGSAGLLLDREWFQNRGMERR